MDEATRKAIEAMQKEAEAEEAAMRASASGAAQTVTETDPVESEMERMQREALEEQAAADAAQQRTGSTDPTHAATAHVARPFKETIHHMLFEMNSTIGQVTNYVILAIILASVFISMLNTIPAIHAEWNSTITIIQRTVLTLFLIEYLLRIYAAKDRKKYMFGFFGIIDFLTVLPLFFGSTGSAFVRLLRLLRILKLAQYFPVLTSLLRSVSDAKNMIFAVLATITAVSVLSGNIAYMLEPETFGNAFVGSWWSLVTMSTVGYGDLVPHTAGGMALGGTLILVGICVVAMMTAVIAVRVGRMVNLTNVCLNCDKPVSAEHKFCPHCGFDQADEIDLFTDED